jgi:ubiquinone/menaquinone biosynthesis C-methylase UbiE
MPMDKKNIIRQQFNIQADKFSNWAITRNIEYMKRYYEFCGIVKDDTLLDVACGTGEYAIFCAQKIKDVCGVDLSSKMIEVARKNASELQLENISFIAQDVFELPFESGRFSIVNSKSAFHHFNDYKTIIGEMKRCCENGGKISVQDIIAYENPEINDYFEKLESLIDISHNKTLSCDFITQLFRDNDLVILRSHTININLNLHEYINHAVQTEERRKEINGLIDYGVNDTEITKYFIRKEGEWYFKKNVFLVLGVKRQ